MFLSAFNKINITLCGMMGSGKSVIAKKLSKKINFDCIDTDNIIEQKVGKSINDIFIQDGEQYFRQLEEEIITDILQKEKYVISLGGGSITNINIRNMLKRNSFNIYLEVDIKTLKNRLENSINRPLIKNTEINKTLIKLMQTREKFYKEADLIIMNNININKTVESIITKLKND